MKAKQASQGTDVWWWWILAGEITVSNGTLMFGALDVDVYTSIWIRESYGHQPFE